MESEMMAEHRDAAEEERLGRLDEIAQEHDEEGGDDCGHEQTSQSRHDPATPIAMAAMIEWCLHSFPVSEKLDQSVMAAVQLQ